MKLRLFLVLLLLPLWSFGQQRLPVVLHRNKPLAVQNPDALARRLAPDTLRVLAIMVDFLTDQDASTSGNGKFQLQTNVSSLIDPPPHDSSFFANKLRFIENYFRKVSNSQLIIRADMLGRVLTLSKGMASYAPGNNTIQTRGLADLAIESWKLADSLIAGIPFSQYGAFVVFHAGVGHDIDVVGFLGYDPTPNDIPSLYLGLKSFQDALQDPTFSGIQTKSGYKITNSVILPETEVRVFGTGTTAETLKVSMNGLSAASIGSHLGLPDLFDTKTGRPAIGQFGLMDGASIFAYSGIFPPEPSAWEKVFLGWATPINVNAAATNLSIPAVGLTNTGQDTIYKIPISNTEYFLVENRNRDPQRNGQQLRIFEKGSIRTENYPRDTLGFTFDDIRLISGSVIDAEDFDWALIGDMQSGTQFEGGGILIWHIDEKIIQEGLAANSVNADPNRRGVDLEEADGAQDIGQVYDLLDPGAASSSGSPLDCWFDGNPSDLYRNIFDKNSFPNSNANSGVQSLVTLKSFSSRSSRMTFSVSFGEAGVKPLPSLTKFVGKSSSENSPQFIDDAVFISKGDSIFSFRLNGKSKVTDTTGLFSAVGGKLPVAANLSATSGPRYFVGVKDSTLFIFNPSDANNDSVYDSVPVSSLNIGNRITTPPSVYFSSPSYRAIVGDAGGNISVIDLASSTKLSTTNVSTFPILSLIGQGWYATSADRIQKQSGEKCLFPSQISGFSVGSSQFLSVVDTVGKNAYFFDVNLNLTKVISLIQYSGSWSPPVIADLNRDGKQELLLTVGNSVLAYNQSGFLLDGFPANLGNGGGKASSVVLADVNGDNDIDIVVTDGQGIVHVLNSHGKSIEALSVDAGDSAPFSPVVFPVSSGIGLSVMDSKGFLHSWQYSAAYSVTNVLWQGTQGEMSHSNFAVNYGGSVQPLSAQFFPRDRVYNWPNPVYGSTTQIRFYTSQDAVVNVKVFDLAGAKVAELNGRGFAGTDSEISWDVSNIQSGVYLARVEATGSSANDVAIIKIAVVK